MESSVASYGTVNQAKFWKGPQSTVTPTVTKITTTDRDWRTDALKAHSMIASCQVVLKGGSMQWPPLMSPYDSMLSACTAYNRTPKLWAPHPRDPILQTPKPYQPLNPQRLFGLHHLSCMHGEMEHFGAPACSRRESSALYLFCLWCPSQMSAFDFPKHMLWPSRGCNREPLRLHGNNDLATILLTGTYESTFTPPQCLDCFTGCGCVH